MNMNFFDNIGSSFTLDSTNNFIIGPSLPGYSTLTNQHKQTYIPYLARNINGKAISWEIGVGYIMSSGGVNQLVEQRFSLLLIKIIRSILILLERNNFIFLLIVVVLTLDLIVSLLKIMILI